ncbi:MAG: LacI family DNA-binding transcriptional regulator [Rhizobiaceae bacterium]
MIFPIGQVQIDKSTIREVRFLKKVGSIREVAQVTGLSTATISRVVNGANNVSEKTRERVLNACRKLDYLPNSAARALTTSRSRTIAAIIPTIEHSVFAKYVAALEQTLNELNYSLVLAISPAGGDPEVEAARKLLGMGADAIILSGCDHSVELVDLLGRREIPHVFSSVWQPDSPTPTIGYDNYHLANQAVEYLKSKGHEKIAIIHGPLQASDRTRARKAGAQSADSIDVDLSFFETELSVGGGKRATEQILSNGIECTAVLCFSDVLALGTYFCLQEAGISIPNQISVMGFDNLDWSIHIEPSLTTINLPAKRMGHEVARQLVGHLEQSVPIEPTIFHGELIERQSVVQIEG